jgi:hypothetical protein
MRADLHAERRSSDRVRLRSAGIVLASMQGPMCR